MGFIEACIATVESTPLGNQSAVARKLADQVVPGVRYINRPRVVNRNAFGVDEIPGLLQRGPLAIKAKLEAVESGISTIEKEFLPFVVMPDGRTVSDHLLPNLKKYVVEGKMPSMLALPAPSRE